MVQRDRRQHEDATPMERTLSEARGRGWYPVPVEAWRPAGPRCPMCQTATFWRRADFLGFADVLALPVLVAIQTTDHTSHASRVSKILNERGAAAWWWLLSGGKIEVWSWRRAARPRNGQYWRLRVTKITRETLLEAGVNPPDIPTYCVELD